jgi:hypothetical protein
MSRYLVVPNGIKGYLNTQIYTTEGHSHTVGTEPIILALGVVDLAAISFAGMRIENKA